MFCLRICVKNKIGKATDDKKAHNSMELLVAISHYYLHKMSITRELSCGAFHNFVRRISFRQFTHFVRTHYVRYIDFLEIVIIVLGTIIILSATKFVRSN